MKGAKSFEISRHLVMEAYQRVKANRGAAGIDEVTVGTPSFLVPPDAFGISTCLTGGGKYDPDDIRFHTLYRFLDRFCSNSAMVSSSMPATPRLALTCWYASQTVRLAMQ